MGILEVLMIIFVVLKGLGFIDWPWLACFIPEMIAVAIYIVCIAIYVHVQRKAHKAVRELEKELEEW